MSGDSLVCHAFECGYRCDGRFHCRCLLRKAVGSCRIADYHFDGNERVYSGVVERHETRAASQLCDVRVASGFLCRVTVGDIMPLMRAGDSIMFRAALERIDMEPGFYDEISEASRLRSRGYSAKALARSSDCDITGEDNSLKYRLRHLVDDFAALAYASPLSQSTSRLAVACRTWRSSAAVPETVESYRASGIAHLLCVSGFHVGIIAAFLAFALYPLRLWSRAGRLRYLFSIAGYMVLCVYDRIANRLYSGLQS